MVAPRTARPVYRRQCPDSLCPPVVLFASYSGAWGGAERLLVEFARGLEGEIWLACPPGPLAERARQAGLRVFDWPVRPLELRGGARNALRAGWALTRHAGDLRELVSGLEPELLVAWNMRSAIATLALPRSSPPVVFQHNDMLPAGPVADVVRRAARRADRVIALSHAVARDLDPGGQLGPRLVVVYPGVDVERFPTRPPGFDPPVVLVLGAIVHWKRPDLALEAFARLGSSHPAARLRFVGAPLDQAGEYLLEDLRRRAQRLEISGAVEFAGQVADPDGELAQATCLLHCAEREPFGLAVLEALAAGRPAVAPNSAGPSEVVDPSCGILYAPGDAGAAAEALERVLSDRRLARRLGQGGRERALRAFDPQASRAAWAAAAGGVRRAPRPRLRAADALSVVTVTHNSGRFVEALLSSIDRHLPATAVIVVDCASSDDTQAVARRCGNAELIALPTNVGFGRACNVGTAAVKTPVTALLNPDVALLDDSLLMLVAEAMGRTGGRRLLAPVLIGPGGRREDSVHPLPGSASELVGALLPVTLVPSLLAAGVAPWRAEGPRRVGWAVGAALVARTELLRRLGPFNERIFLYGEDLDLGFRAACEGIEIWFDPRSRVLHHRAHSTREVFGGEPLHLLARARRQAVAARLGRRGLLLDDLSQGLTFLLRGTVKTALGRGGERERGQLAALWRVRRSRLRP
jgi:glycosyltransferase involved in cell wall biosynthesis/GT2 family glycosyltransferase